MPATKTNIIGEINLPNGTTHDRAHICFALSGFDTEASADVIISTDKIWASIDSSGNIDVDLWATTTGERSRYYSVSLVIGGEIYGKDKTVDLGLIEVPATGGPYDLNDMLAVDPPAGMDLSEYLATIAAQAQAAEDAAALAASLTFSGSRASFIAKNTAGDFDSFADGATLFNEGLAYVREDGATTIADLADWVPSGEWNAGHFDDITDAVTAAVAADAQFLRVDTDHAEPASLDGKSNVMLVGKGSIAGTNSDTPAYRRPVVPMQAPYAHAFPEHVRMSKPRGTALTVVVVGDSLTTFGADVLSAGDVLTERLEAKLKAENPDRDITVYSRGIGGTTLDDLDDVPSLAYPVADRYPWYDNDTRDWLDYVDDLDPDIVIVSMGMNDKQNFDRTKLESVVTKLEAMTADPNIIFATNMVPNLSPESGAWGSYAEQEGRDFAAGYIRSFARYHGYGLIDINRTFNMVRDGRDILNCELVEQPLITSPIDGIWTATAAQACREYSVRAVFEAGAIDSIPINVKLGPDTANIVLIDDSGGFVRFRFYAGGASSLYKTVVSGIAVPAAETEWEFTVRSGLFTARIIPSASGAEAGVDPVTVHVLQGGGLFAPQIKYQTGGGGPVVSAVFGMGVEKAYRPTILDIDLWGTEAGDEGNGRNHPTSAGAAEVYGKHFAASTYYFGAVNNEPYGFNFPMLATVDGTGSVGAGNIVDGTRLLPTNLAGATGSAPSQLIGTTWMCCGRVTGTGTDDRITNWIRVT